MTATYKERLTNAIESTNSKLCAELSFAHSSMLPNHDYDVDTLFDVMCSLVESTVDKVPVYKITPDIYWTLGDQSDELIEKICKFIRSEYSDKILVCDGRFSGSDYTNSKYHRKYTENGMFDAVTMFAYPDALSLTPMLTNDQSIGMYVIAPGDFPSILRFIDQYEKQESVGLAFEGDVPNLYMQPTLRRENALTLALNVKDNLLQESAMYSGDMGIINAYGYIKKTELNNWAEALSQSYSKSKYLLNDSFRTRSALKDLVTDLRETDCEDPLESMYHVYMNNAENRWAAWRLDENGSGTWINNVGQQSQYVPAEVLHCFGIVGNHVQINTFLPGMFANFMAMLNVELQQDVVQGKRPYASVQTLFDIATPNELATYLEMMPYTVFHKT